MEAKPNRKKTQKNTGSDWCHSCDRSFLPAGKKCPVCGKRKYKKYRRKIKA